MQPVGTNVGPVQFDAVIEENPPLSGSHILLCARYWVGPDYYRVAVIWAEPHVGSLNFSIYPPTLSIGSDRERFSLSHDIVTNKNALFRKHIESRGVFHSQYGDYNIANIRFAEQEALSTKIFADDLKGLNDSNQIWSNRLGVKSDAQPNRAVAEIGITTDTCGIQSLDVFGKGQQLLRKIHYKYDTSTTPPQLAEQEVFLPERLMSVGFYGDGATVASGGSKYQLKDFPTVHEKGGRKCKVHYESVSLGQKVARLPVRVEVWAPDGKLIRSARMMSFRPIGLTPGEAQQAAAKFCGFTPDHLQYRELLIKYWQTATEQLSAEDIRNIKDLREKFLQHSFEDNTLGERLRRVNILIELNRLIDDQKEIKRHFQSYLSLLKESGLTNMMFFGGCGSIETAVLWGRYSEATALLDEWISVISNTFDLESLLPFAYGELKRGNSWTVARLLEGFSCSTAGSIGAQFERAGLRLFALRDVQQATQNPPGLARDQGSWATAAVGRLTVANLFTNSETEVLELVNLPGQLTPFQAALKMRVQELVGNRRGK